MRSKRDVVVGDALVGEVRRGRRGRGARGIGCAGGLAVAASAFAARFRADEGEVVNDDLRAVSLLAAFLVVPRAVGDFAFDEKRGALLDVILGGLGEFVEADEVMPFGFVYPIPLCILGAIRRSQGKVGDRHAARGGTNFGVFADVAEKKYFVDAFCHFSVLRFPVDSKDEDSRSAFVGGRYLFRSPINFAIASASVSVPVGRQPIAIIRASQPEFVCGPWRPIPPNTVCVSKAASTPAPKMARPVRTSWRVSRCIVRGKTRDP